MDIFLITNIDRKVDIDAQTQMGWTSLMFAAHEGHLNIVKLLLEKKANATITTYDIVDLEDKYKMQCKTVIEIVEMKNEYIKEKVDANYKHLEKVNGRLNKAESNISRIVGIGSGITFVIATVLGYFIKE